MLNKESSHTNATTTNQSENSGITCLSFLSNDDWISDKGHMITVPDGRKITVKYIGIVTLQNGVILLNVLYVPQFKFNLISVKKLLDDLKCKLIFDHHGCHVQENLMKRHWLLGKTKSVLYVFEGPRSEDSDLHEEH